MSVTTRIRDFFNAVTPAGPSRIYTVDQLAKALAAGNATASGAAVTEDNAMTVSAVYSCVRLLAEGVAVLPAALYRMQADDSHVLEKSHPLNDVLSIAPNDVQSAFDFARYRMVCLLLRGNFYARKIMQAGRVTGLVALHPDRIAVKAGADGRPLYEYRRPDGGTEIVPREQMFHVRHLSQDGIVGRSVLSAAREAIGMALQTEKYGARIYANGVKPAGIVKHPGNLSAEAVERLVKQISERHSGPDAAQGVLVLEEGMDWQSIFMSPQDAEFINTRRYQVSDIARFFGVPPHMIGDVERSTSWGSGLESQGLAFLAFTLQPYLTNFEQAARMQLLSLAERRTMLIKHDVSSLTRGSFLQRQQGFEIMRRNEVINANEWRRAEGYNPRTDAGGAEFEAPQNQAKASEANENAQTRNTASEEPRT